MTTPFFTAGDTRYFWIGAALILADKTILASLVPRKTYFWLHVPWTFLHELMHWFVAIILGGRADMSNLAPKLREDGLYELGSVRYSGVNAVFGPGLIAMAPLLNWIAAAAFYYLLMYARPMGFAEGVASVVLLVGLIEAGIPSWADIKDGAFISFCIMAGLVAGVVLVSGPTNLLRHLGIM